MSSATRGLNLACLSLGLVCVCFGSTQHVEVGSVLARTGHYFYFAIMEVLPIGKQRCPLAPKDGYPPSPFRPPFCFIWPPPDHMITGSLFIVYLMHPVDSINLCSFIIHNSPPWPWKTLELTIGRAHPIGLHFYPYHLTPPRKKE